MNSPETQASIAAASIFSMSVLQKTACRIIDTTTKQLDISDKAKKIKVSSETAPVTVSILISEKNTACLSAHRKKVFLLWENLTGSQTRGIKKTQKEREKKWRR